MLLKLLRSNSSSTLSDKIVGFCVRKTQSFLSNIPPQSILVLQQSDNGLFVIDLASVFLFPEDFLTQASEPEKISQSVSAHALNISP